MLAPNSVVETKIQYGSLVFFMIFDSFILGSICARAQLEVKCLACSRNIEWLSIYERPKYSTMTSEHGTERVRRAHAYTYT